MDDFGVIEQECDHIDFDCEEESGKMIIEEKVEKVEKVEKLVLVKMANSNDPSKPKVVGGDGVKREGQRERVKRVRERVKRGEESIK